MLLNLRETVRNSKPIKYSLITLICIPFALVGIGSYFSGGYAPTVAEVNGEEITQTQLDGAVQQQRQRLAQMFGGRLPEGFGDDAALREQALEQLVTQQLLVETVADQGFAVSDETLGKAIRSLPAFQVEERFDNDTYQTQLRASGLSVAAFEQSFRDDTALNQFRTGIIDTSFTLPSEAERLDKLARQTRTVDAVRFDLDAAKEAVEPNEDDVAAHFEANKDSYRFPPRAKIEYIELDSAAMAESIDVTDAEAEARYAENKASYMRPEQREASHIMVSVDPDAADDELGDERAVLEAAVARVAGGEAFEDVAREVSEDIGSSETGGSLGIIAEGSISAAFDEALNALASEGDLSEPVRSDTALHVIRLDKIIPESGKPFEEVREEIIASMRQEQADREYFELNAELSELVFDESTTLQPAADAAGLEVQSTDWLDADNIVEAGPVLSTPAVFDAINDPDIRDDGNNSDLIEVGPRHVIALRVTESEDERPMTLDDVREQIIDEIKSERAGERLDTLAESARETLATSADPTIDFADEPLAELLVGEVLERQSTVFDGAVVAEIFALARPSAEAGLTGEATLDDGDRLAYILRAVNDPSTTTDESLAESAGGSEGGSEVESATGSEAVSPPPVGDPRVGGVEFQALLGSLREQASVDVNP